MKNGPYEFVVAPADYPGKRYRGRYAYEHRVNWWRENGLNPDEFPSTVVHHKDEAKRNNDPPNLEMKGRAAHSSHHARKKTMIAYTCLSCGIGFERRKGKEHKFCSRRCIGLYGYNKR
jgi:hypothetical protein